MNLQPQATNDRIVDLLNQASLMSKDADKITNLKIVEELIINKEPKLLDNFLEEVLAFQSDRSVEVKKYIIHFMAVAGKTDPFLLPKIVGSMMMMLSEENMNIVKVLVLNMAHIFKATFYWIGAVTQIITPKVTRTWEQVLRMIDLVSEFIDSENEGLRSNAIKFLEAVILAFSNPPEDDVNLSVVREYTPLINRDELKERGMECFNKLMAYQSSTHISSMNLITAMSSMTTIAKLRPSYLGQVVQAFESLHVNLPPTLTNSQVSSVRKQLKMQLLSILRLPAAVSYQSNIAILLTDLGASQSEILKNMPKTDNTRKRKAEENSVIIKKAKTEPVITLEGESSLDFEDPHKNLGSTSKQQVPPHLYAASASTMDNSPPSNIFTDDNQPVGQPTKDDPSKLQSAVDITAEDLIDRLTPQNVTNLVLESMVLLPDQMPPSFQSTYTPIAAAGTKVQIMHLARLLAAQLTNAKLGKGYEAIEAYRREEKERFIREKLNSEAKEKEVSEKSNKNGTQTIETVMGGSVVSCNQNEDAVANAETEEEEVIPQALVIQPMRKRVVQFNIEQAVEPMTREQMANHARYLSEKLLGSQDVGLVNELKRTMNVKICSSNKDIRNEYLLRIFADLRNFKSTAMALIFDEYLNCKVHAAKGQHKALESYEECVVAILTEVLNRPDLKDGGLFRDFIFEIPLLTPGIIEILKHACLDESNINVGMSALRELVLKRPSLRGDYLNMLLSFSTHNKMEVRQNALRVVKSLHESSDLKDIIECHAMKLLKYLLNPSPPQELANLVSEGGSWSDELIRMCLYLYLALLPAKHALIHELASVYTSSSSEIKRVILRVIEMPVKGMGMDSPELLLLVENCPKGAETLVTRVIHILTDKVVPSPELVNKVRDLYQRRVSDVRFLIPVLNGLTKNEVVAALPKLIKLNPVVVKEVFNRLLGVNGQESRPSSLSPMELLVTLHTLDPAKADMKAIIKACNLCFAEKSVYTQEVLASVMQQLMEINPLPTLLMRTVIQSLATYPKLSGFVLNILKGLIAKQVWRNKRVWEGFVKCCQRTKPQSHQVLLQLPATQLKDAFLLCPELREPLLNHVSALTPHQRAHIQKATMSILEKPPSGNPQGFAEQVKLKQGEGEDKNSLQSLKGELKMFHKSSVFSSFENSPRSGHVMKDDMEGFECGLPSEEEDQGAMA